jgi:hypothetical protein
MLLHNPSVMYVLCIASLYVCFGSTSLSFDASSVSDGALDCVLYIHFLLFCTNDFGSTPCRTLADAIEPQNIGR